MYYTIRDNSISKTTVFIIQIEIFISTKFLIDNNLKRKLKYSTNINCFINIVATQTSSIANYLVRKLKLNKLIILLSILISILIKNSINKTNILQLFYKISTKFKKEL